MKAARRSMAATTNQTPAVAMTSVRPEAVNCRSKDAAITITTSNVVANTRPKALKYIAALSMVSTVTDQATTHSSDTAKGEEQLTNNMRR
jgi:hypothetical protein